MAGTTRHFSVFSRKGEISGIMIKAGRHPVIHVVTTRTGRCTSHSKLIAMRILVTTFTICRAVLEELSQSTTSFTNIKMTIGASHFLMCSEKRPCSEGVIKAYRRPFLRKVALSTVLGGVERR